MAVLQLGALRGRLATSPQDLVQLGLQVRLLLGEPLQATGCSAAGQTLRLMSRPFDAAAMGTSGVQARLQLGGGRAGRPTCRAMAKRLSSSANSLLACA